MLNILKKNIALTVFAIILNTSTNSFAAQHNNSYQPTDTITINKDSFVPLYKYLANTIRYPRSARENSTTGPVIVSFTLNTDGYIQNVQADNSSIKNDCDEEVKRVLLGFKDKNKQLRSGDYKIAVIFRFEGQPIPAIDPDLKKQPNFLNSIVITALIR